MNKTSKSPWLQLTVPGRTERVLAGPGHPSPDTQDFRPPPWTVPGTVRSGWHKFRGKESGGASLHLLDALSLS